MPELWMIRPHLGDLKSAGEERMTGGGASRPGRVDALGEELQTNGEI